MKSIGHTVGSPNSVIASEGELIIRYAKGAITARNIIETIVSRRFDNLLTAFRRWGCNAMAIRIATRG
tara:strand:+ start:221 stop:424 length:204 start_codon:yes stop_codon:yes gene_type:complete